MSCKAIAAFNIKKYFDLDNCQDFSILTTCIHEKTAAYIQTETEKKKIRVNYFSCKKG